MARDRDSSTGPVLAIDGPAGSGKSTVARIVAARSGASLLDSGAIYRALALQAERQGVGWDAEAELTELAGRLPLRFVYRDGENRVDLAGEDVSATIRTPAISRGASTVSKHPRVRGALLALQRELASYGPLVAEGRDMGTVVFPDAQLKIFLDAGPRQRARRRLAELRDAGHDASLEEVLAAQTARDRADSEREAAPLVAAADAVRIDTGGLTVEQVVDRILAMWEPLLERVGAVARKKNDAGVDSAGGPCTTNGDE